MTQEAEHVRLAHIKDDPGEMTDPQIAEWFLELLEGKRTAATRMVPVERVRSNPFAPLLGEATVKARLLAVTSGQWEPELWVAALPERRSRRRGHALRLRGGEASKVQVRHRPRPRHAHQIRLRSDRDRGLGGASRSSALTPRMSRPTIAKDGRS